MGKVHVNNNQILLPQLIQIYQPLDIDWLAYQITKGNVLTVHHVTKQEHGGPTSIDNSALLTKKAHRVLHICEHKDFILYEEINDFFREIIRAQSFNEVFQEESKKYKKVLTKTIY